MRLIRGLGKVLWFELLWKVLILVLVNPLFQDVYQTYVASVGVSFNSGILSTFLSLKGAALFAVLFLAAAGLIVSGGENSPYIWARTPDGMGSWEFFDLLLEKANVVTTPGAGFGPSGEGYIRVTAFGDAQATQEAVERIVSVLG